MLIDIRNLSVSLSGKVILHEVNLSLEAGKIYGLIGPNGAGKSTTIAAALGLVETRGGTIRVFGADPRHNPTCVYRRLGVLPEQNGFYGWMSARDYLGFFARLYRRHRSPRDLVKQLARVGLAAHAERSIATFSQGMRQRLSLARALIGDPELLILDSDIGDGRHHAFGRTTPRDATDGDHGAGTGQPAAPQMGDGLSFHSVIRNDGTAPVDGVISWISLIRVDPGEELPVDLEDWSAQKAVTAAPLAPGASIDIDWPMRLIQAGHYRVEVSAITREASILSSSPFADFTVREKLVVESQRVLPVAFGIPLILAGLLVWRTVRRR